MFAVRPVGTSSRRFGGDVSAGKSIMRRSSHFSSWRSVWNFAESRVLRDLAEGRQVDCMLCTADAVVVRHLSAELPSVDARVYRVNGHF